MNADQIERAEANARRKWKATGDPVWAYAEAALAWARGSRNVDQAIHNVLAGLPVNADAIAERENAAGRHLPLGFVDAGFICDACTADAAAEDAADEEKQ